MRGNIVTPPPPENPEDMLRERAVTRLASTGEIDEQPDSAREAIADLTNAQIRGIGNLGLSLVQVRRTNYTDYTPNAISTAIVPNTGLDRTEPLDNNTDTLTILLNIADPNEAQEILNDSSRVIQTQRTEGGLNLFDTVTQLTPSRQEQVARGTNLTDALREQNILLRPASMSAGGAESLDAETDGRKPAQEQIASPPIEQIYIPTKYLSNVASMPEERAESPDEEKNSFVEKELKRKRDSDSRDSKDDKKPRGR